MKKRVVKLNPQESDGVTRRGRGTRCKGPYTLYSESLAKQYLWKAGMIVRFFRVLKMTEKQKIKFLAKELAGTCMHGEYRGRSSVEPQP